MRTLRFPSWKARAGIRRLRVVGLVALITLTTTVVAGPASGARDAPNCAPVTVFGLRGTFQNSPTDGKLGGELQVVKDTLPSSVSVVSIDKPAYPATFIPPPSVLIIDGVIVLTGIAWEKGASAFSDALSQTRQSYDASRAGGYSALAGQIRALVNNRSCPDSKFAMMGYSQGAHIVGDMTQTLLNEGLSGIPRDTAAKRWIGSYLLADPAFNPAGGDAKGEYDHTGASWGLIGRRAAYPPSAAGKILSLCGANDIVCDFHWSHLGIGFDWNRHLSYTTNQLPNSAGSTYAKYGADWLNGLIKPFLAATPGAATSTAPPPAPHVTQPPPSRPSTPVPAPGPPATSVPSIPTVTITTLARAAPVPVVDYACANDNSNNGKYVPAGRFWGNSFTAQGSVVTGGQVLIGAAPGVLQQARVGIYSTADLSQPLATTVISANDYQEKSFTLPQPLSVTPGRTYYLMVVGIGNFSAYDNASAGDCFIGEVDGFQ